MEKAYQRVLTDSASFKSIGERWCKLQPPCSNDTIIGETEVLILSDTQYIPYKPNDWTWDSIVKSINKANNTIPAPSYIPIITNTKVETKTKIGFDRKAEQALNDTINAMRVKMAALKGQRDTLTQLYNDGLKEAKKPNYWKWALIGLVGVIIAWRFYPKIKL